MKLNFDVAETNGKFIYVSFDNGVTKNKYTIEEAKAGIEFDKNTCEDLKNIKIYNFNGTITTPQYSSDIRDSYLNEKVGVECVSIDNIGSVLKKDASLRIVGITSANLGNVLLKLETSGHKYDLSSTIFPSNTTFNGLTCIKSITLPNTELLKKGTVCNCANLESVYIAKETKEIAPNAFSRCPKLKSVVFNDMITWGRTGFDDDTLYINDIVDFSNPENNVGMLNNSSVKFIKNSDDYVKLKNNNSELYISNLTQPDKETIEL